MKEYKNPNELLEHIKTKGIIVLDNNSTLEKIKKYSYYSIINSYKDVFKNSDNEYNEGVSFDEIFALYEFDKNLRLIFLKYILEIEINIKSILSEVISANYGIKDYLIVKNYDETIDETLIQESIDKIQDEINKQNGKHTAITHYINKYGFVPPYVLIKILTLGELSKLFTMLKQIDRQLVSKEFKISDKLLKQIMKNMTLVRNICAHNDRLFSFHSKFLISFKQVDKDYMNKDKSTNIYMIGKSMQLLLGDAKGKEFAEEIICEFAKLKYKVKSTYTDKILCLMGFYE